MAPRAPKENEKAPAKSEKAAKPAKMKAKPAETAEAPAGEAAPGGAIKLKDLIEAVAKATGGKKPDVKAAVEATLAAMGEGLAAGKAMTLPPLGKLRVVKTKGPALTLKLRLAEGAKAAGLALADDGEDG